MKVLLDQGVPVPLRSSIPAEVSTCYEKGWSRLSNGELLLIAEKEFDAFVTCDKNLGYQQNLDGRKIAIFVLPTTRWPLLKMHASQIGSAIAGLRRAAYLEWEIPNEES